MLKLFQNQGKALRWIMGGLLFLIAASMVITLVPNVFGPAGPASADVLAEVGDRAVTIRDVELELRQYRRQDVPPEAVAMMAGNVVEDLIADRVLFVEARSSGVGADRGRSGPLAARAAAGRAVPGRQVRRLPGVRRLRPAAVPDDGGRIRAPDPPQPHDRNAPPAPHHRRRQRWRGRIEAQLPRAQRHRPDRVGRR